MLAAHHNCRALVPGDRQLSDEQIRALLARDAVIGVALDSWMLYPDYGPGETDNSLGGDFGSATQLEVKITPFLGWIRQNLPKSDLSNSAESFNIKLPG